MAPETISVLISSFPGLTLSVPYDKSEPLHYLRDRVSNCLYGTTACVDPEVASLYLDGKAIPDYDEAMDLYELFGDVLTYKNAKIEDYQSLKVAHLAKPSRLPSMVTVRVLTVTGQNIAVSVPVGATVEELKWAISNALIKGLPVRKQHLYFNGTELQDEKALADYSIKSNTVIHLLTQLTKYPTVSIYVKTLTQKTHVLQVNLGQTVYRLKKFIQDMVKIPIDEQRLVFGGNQLENDHILHDYHISDGCTISISLRLAGGLDLLPTFVDVSTAQTETLPFSKNAREGCVVGSGTNIEIKCECTSYNVDSIQGFGLYEFGKSTVTCPNCHSTDVKPITVSFVQCAYQIHGVKADWTTYKSDWIEVREADRYQRYDPSKQVGWRRLGIESKPLFRCKTPVCTICLEDILDCEKTLSCGHRFHKKCITSWKLQCPNCRAFSV